MCDSNGHPFAKSGGPTLEECSGAAASEVSLPFFGPLLHKQRQIEVCESPPHLNADKHDKRAMAQRSRGSFPEQVNDNAQMSIWTLESRLHLPSLKEGAQKRTVSSEAVPLRPGEAKLEAALEFSGNSHSLF